MTGDDSDEELGRVRAGDRAAFERLVAPQLPRLRGLCYRILGHPEDAADAVQEALLRAFSQVGTFRGGARFSTWLVRIATNVCLDVLRARGRWRVEAQPMSKDECMRDGASLHHELRDTAHDQSFAFDVHEHIAFCFTCVARTLDADTEVALMLSELFDVDNQASAAMLGISESVYRHRLSAGRAQMEGAFDGLCALVSKTGVCYQCKELRDYAPEGRRGPEVPAFADDPPPSRWRKRLAIVKDAPLDTGVSRPLHDLLFRWIAAHARADDAA